VLKRKFFNFKIFAGIWTFLFLICFIMLETQWTEEEDKEKDLIGKAGATSSIRAAIWFSFLSIPVWVSQ
jgi:hypothetical protein